ncbi:MAG: mannitol dehydrogenase family protein [Pseudomonadota bacterium]
MNRQSPVKIHSSGYDRDACKIGVVHLGIGAFHRAHQAVYIDRYMDQTGDLSWGIAAVNLRAEDSAGFTDLIRADGYLLKTTTPEGEANYTQIRPHIAFADWASDPIPAEALLALPSVHIVSMTVTESGYYLNDDWTLNDNDPVVAAELRGGEKRSVYAYLAAGLRCRMSQIDAPITVVCCDNIRSNGAKLAENFKTYLRQIGDTKLLNWVVAKASFPNSMVDRITPRATDALFNEILAIAPNRAATAIHGEDYIQWTLQNDFASSFPNLSEVGVEIVDNVDPYEEAKIRILNGGHTALCYLGALAGHHTFDQVMTDTNLRAHFDAFETKNVLPGLTIDLPFDKSDYLDLIAARFSNAAIADDLARICMDGWSKFPIFIRPTIKSCLAQNITPHAAFDSVASWYVYARRFAKGRTHIPYSDPYWHQMQPLLAEGQEAAFAGLEALWSNLPTQYDNFVPELTAAIEQMEHRWPV